MLVTGSITVNLIIFVKTTSMPSLSYPTTLISKSNGATVFNF